jgi:probable rRNA maturation factor
MMAKRDSVMSEAKQSSSGSLSVEVDAGETAWTALGDLDVEAAVREIATAIAGHVGLPAARATATLVLSSDAEVRALNGKWRDQDKPTNVLSFPSAPIPSKRVAGSHPGQPRFLGDVIIAEETLAREAGDQGIATADHFRHLAVHGLLHLLGYDHEIEAEANTMEMLETRILGSIGVRDPYAGTEPVDDPPSPASATGRR